MRRFYIPPEDIGRHRAILKGEEARHAINVLRLGKGDDAVVFDGRGKEYAARIATLDGRQVTLDLVAELPGRPESPLRLTLAQGYLKDKKMDRLVPQLTELGVARWIPFLARRSVALPDDRRQSKRRRRWEKLSLASLKQCRRSLPMIIDPVVTFDEVLALSKTFGHKWVFYEDVPAAVDWQSLNLEASAEVLVLIGPEGGFAPHEIAAAGENGLLTLGLGPRILRAETAALATAAILQARFGDIGAARPADQNCP
jgi:16S rRNA (uracil1498-N3)-methyltransferase